MDHMISCLVDFDLRWQVGVIENMGCITSVKEALQLDSVLIND